ncbi:MAG: site-specific integrase [Acidobacteria bacterium]|nr:site-specific integrase [Acidobacteriota bacterium]
MPRANEGSVKFHPQRKALYARFTYLDEDGKRREKRQQVKNVTEGKQLIEQWQRELAEKGSQHLDAAKMTFAHLAEDYKKRKLKPAQYRDDTKVSGMRSYRHQLSYLKTLLEHFGKRLVQSIRHSHLEDYREQRLNMPTRHGRERTAAGVHRELQLMRAILNYAVREGYLQRNPFTAGESLIRHSEETKRERILSLEEEQRLLLACTDKRDHLRPLVICAIDTGLRRGEMMALQWQDVDFADGVIRARKTTTKTRKARSVGITPRLRAELETLKLAMKADTDFVFPQREFAKAFRTAKRLAGLDDLHWHDLRHSMTTRLVESGMADKFIMKLTGHEQQATFLRYVNPNEDTARQAADSLQKLQDDYAEAEKASGYVN